MSEFLIVGAGITGATIAERLSRSGHYVTILDRRNHIAGNCYDYIHPSTDVMIHGYGPHIFHTNSGRIWSYINQFSKFRPYRHRVLGHIAGLHPFSVPVNANSMRTLFGSEDCKRYARAIMDRFSVGANFTLTDLNKIDNDDIREFRSRLFDMVYKGYLTKHWGPYADHIDDSVLNRVPIRLSSDDVFFSDKYQGVPEGGYTAMVGRMLDHENIDVLTGIEYHSSDPGTKIIWTGCIDQYFDYCFGELPYRSLEFRNLVSRSPDKIMSCGQYVFNDASVPITRTVEHRWLTGQDSLWTVRTSEFPCEYVPGKNEPFYPVPCQNSAETYAKYLDLSKEVKGTVLFAGRLGKYQYFSMAQAIGNALSLFESESEFFN